MSGWLGTINYGVITANKIDSFLRNRKMGKNPLESQEQDSSFAIA
jgi:hypothetical protein